MDPANAGQIEPATVPLPLGNPAPYVLLVHLPVHLYLPVHPSVWVLFVLVTSVLVTAGFEVPGVQVAGFEVVVGRAPVRDAPGRVVVGVLGPHVGHHGHLRTPDLGDFPVRDFGGWFAHLGDFRPAGDNVHVPGIARHRLADGLSGPRCRAR
ncbi:hypothetical protein LK08_31785 [Streptomyces sp. MUSC 125]|nr:hypothetical protein LK08_31785 [Streptomyces sp. MUSC 125]